MTNDFLPFCPTDTGTNLLTEADYAATSDRTSGNKPGVASAKLSNKALRQSSYVVSQIAQYLANQTGTDVLDDATPAKLLAQIQATLQFLPTVVTTYIPGIVPATHPLTYVFFIVSGSAMAGAAYSNNGKTFLVSTTISAGTLLTTTGSGYPTVSGTLTKMGGTGDTTITFYAMRMPLYLRAVGQAGGGGGSGSGGSGGNGSGTTSFGTSLCTANPGSGATGGIGGTGGDATITAPATGLPTRGNSGSCCGGNISGSSGGNGGGGRSGGAGVGGFGGANNAGTAGASNTGAGGGGAGVSGASGGGGGGSGGSFDCIIPVAPAYVPLVSGFGSGGTGTSVGGNGANGQLQIYEMFQ